MEQKSGLGLCGTYEFTKLRNGVELERWTEKNLIPLEGLNLILNMINSTTAEVAWYVGLGIGNYTVASTDTAANIAGAGRANETSAYTSSTRPVVTLTASTAASTTNSAAVAVFAFNAGVTITNAFVVSSSTKGGTLGAILSSLKLGTSRTMQSGDNLEVTFTLSAASV